MVDKDLEVVVRIVPGSTSVRVMMETVEYLKIHRNQIALNEGETGEVDYLIDSLQQSLQEMPNETGADMIAVERAGQQFGHGYSHEHDDQWTGGELIEAACAYGTSAEASYFSETVTFKDIISGRPPTCWPWKKDQWKRSSTPIGDLVKAGALIAAEIDRLKRILEKELNGGGLS